MVENCEFAAFARRILRAMARRAGGDVEALPQLQELAVLVDDAMRDAVAACRAESYSWGEIAQRLGTTRQAAQQRYGRADNGSAVKRQGTLDGQTTIDEHLVDNRLSSPEYAAPGDGS